jgi:beta,beta-carotene 9',10'-dioxygenase
MADGNAPMTSRPTIESTPPFRAPAERRGARDAQIEGELPAWLRGTLYRTAPARFAAGDWRAEHWFDALGMLFAFDVDERGASVRWRDVESAHASELQRGRNERAMFATPMRRGALGRLSAPVPKATDNANVNIVPRGSSLVALTESEHQLVIDPATLAVRHEHAWRDKLGAMMGLAHPEFDREKRRWVDVSSQLSGRPALVVIEHDDEGRERTVVGRWSPGRIPYVHSFGLTRRSVLLIAHPFSTNPLTMLFSERGFIEHFHWQNGEQTRIGVLSREDGSVREVRAPAGFVFHVIDAFDDGDDTVLDVLLYPDASIVAKLRTETLLREVVAITPTPTRWRIHADRDEVTSTALSREGFEFAQVDRAVDGRDRTRAWGTALSLDGPRSRSTVIALDLRSGAHTRYEREGVVYGEPVFVRRPDAREEGDGVLLAVGSRCDSERSVLTILDARRMQPVAEAWVDVALPLGFHGGFARSR